jgi:hypothetical protein
MVYHSCGVPTIPLHTCVTPYPPLRVRVWGDKGTGTAPGTEKNICTRTCGTRICQPAGYSIPVSNTKEKKRKKKGTSTLPDGLACVLMGDEFYEARVNFEKGQCTETKAKKGKGVTEGHSGCLKRGQEGVVMCQHGSAFPDLGFPKLKPEPWW